MANFSIYFPTLLVHEGGYNEVAGDKGGATKYGIAFKTWMENGWDKDNDGDVDKDDLKLITPKDAEFIAKKKYWDVIKGDQIKSQSIAEFLFDFAYNSGANTAVKKLQTVLDLTDDGVIGPKTLQAVNTSDQKTIFDQLIKSRLLFVEAIVKNNPSQKKFLNGWKARINSFKFKD